MSQLMTLRMLMPRSSFVAPVLCCWALSSAVDVFSADWEHDAGLAANVYVTDNFCMSRDQEEAETVATLMPRLRLSGQGARAQMALDGRVELNSLKQADVECPLGGQGANRSNRESVIPSGRFFAAAEAVENLLFLEATASASLNPVNPFGAGINDAINGRQNTNIAHRWGVGARLEQEFDQTVGATLRYNYNEQYNSANQVYGDSVEDLAEFDVSMLPGSSRVLFGVNGRYRETSFEGTDFSGPFSSTLSSVEGTMAIMLSRKWQLNARGGEEFNDFISVNDEIEGTYWDTGIQWTPNTRVTVNLGTGRRFFGDTPRADISYRHRRSSLTLGYSKSLVNPRNLRAAQVNAIDDVSTPDLGALPGDPIGGDDNPVLVGDSPIINEAFVMGYTFTARRTTLNIRLRDSRQIRAADLGEAQFQNAAISVSRTLSSGFSAAARVGWRQSESEGDFVQGLGQDVEAWTGGLSITRQLARRTSLSLAYRYLDQQSNLALNTFVENRLTLSINHSFR